MIRPGSRTRVLLPCSRISLLREDRSIRPGSPETCVLRWRVSSLMLRRIHGAAGFSSALMAMVFPNASI